MLVPFVWLKIFLLAVKVSPLGYTVVKAVQWSRKIFNVQSQNQSLLAWLLQIRVQYLLEWHTTIVIKFQCSFELATIATENLCITDCILLATAKQKDGVVVYLSYQSII